MSHELFFIQVVEVALRARDPHDALRDAFETIREKGGRRKHRRGYRQFLQWMRRVLEARAELDLFETQAATRLVKITTDDDELIRRSLAADEMVHSSDWWRAAYEEMLAESSVEQRSKIELLVTISDRTIGVITIGPPDWSGRLGGIVPGAHTVALDTGWVVWAQELTGEDLLWRAAHPDRPVAFAAATEDRADRPSAEWAVLDGDLAIRVFPGFEAGSIEVCLSKRDHA